jgi:predicted nucleic acid-binding protein
VFDASALVRSVVGPKTEVQPWIAQVLAGDLEGLVPDLVYAEIANALLVYVRSGLMRLEDAIEASARLARLPLEAVPLGRLGAAVLETALALGLSAYDTFYVAVAELEDAILVTADRRLAAAYDRSALVS